MNVALKMQRVNLLPVQPQCRDNSKVFWFFRSVQRPAIWPGFCRDCPGCPLTFQPYQNKYKALIDDAKCAAAKPVADHCRPLGNFLLDLCSLSTEHR